METNTQNTTTQTDKIRDWLLMGNTLTALESLDRFKCWRLGARAWDLRQAGYNVQSMIVKMPSGKRVASYYIPEHQPLITPTERKKKPKSITIEKLRELAREVADGDLLVEMMFSKLIIAAEKS